MRYPNIGIDEVPDKQLNEIAGFVSGARKGEGLRNRFLSHIRDEDAIIHFVRSLKKNNIIHVEGNLNLVKVIEIIETELLVWDIVSVGKRIEKLKILLELEIINPAKD